MSGTKTVEAIPLLKVLKESCFGILLSSAYTNLKLACRFCYGVFVRKTRLIGYLGVT
jgi:hypothetical protein